ncbi:MAG: DUF2073 domain-containing protein [Nanoarchaeota archaeon]|nr:DUF2073 domain-containing protein [Nanoarchaeota archaeon]
MLTLQFIPHFEISNLKSDAKIKKLLKIVKEDKILLVEGRLSAEEEAKLIQKTMEQITTNFKGIEICSVDPKKQDVMLLEKLKAGLAKILLGDKSGLTIIGPASIVKEIKKDPNKIELLTKEYRKKRKK